MVNTDAVAVVMVEANKLIDKLELSAGVFGASEKVFLAAYQAKLASARTKPGDDMRFGAMFLRYMTVKAMKT